MTDAELTEIATKLLASIPGAGQNARAVVALLKSCAPRFLPDGEVLCREGQNGDSVYFLVRGRLRVQTNASDANRGLFTQQAPAMLGQMSLVDGSPRSATLVASGPADLLVLSQATWTQLYGAPTVVGGVLRRLVLASLTHQLARASYLMNDLLPDSRDNDVVDMRSLGRIAGVVEGWDLDGNDPGAVEVVRPRH